ncbi:hypothetical protein BGZ95_004894 [Linnemannia exigua]|uniref:Chitin-binding type-4 domain-containing protein n=1 Tax=Linnemannia exigua TaxID=604196 RepID=A0AAD4H2U9_9FUNG|nr:hypothetical protein BGZ95_004894 [Linnemannia exigua]
MVFKSSLTVLLVATLAVFSSHTPQAEAHSWIDCVDWRLKSNKPLTGKSGAGEWTDAKGACHGYARRYPTKPRFASLDDADPNRHYQQGHNKVNNQPACSNGRDGEEPGADETRPPKLEDAYYKTSGKNSGWGKMTVIKPGGKLCIRWPAKNHAGDRDGGKVLINIMKDDMAKNHPQSVLNKKEAFQLDYSKCDKAKNSDVRPCGGCITLPEEKYPTGTYLLQWRWRLNDDEWYTSCADVKIDPKAK